MMFKRKNAANGRKRINPPLRMKVSSLPRRWKKPTLKPGTLPKLKTLRAGTVLRFSVPEKRKEKKRQGLVKKLRNRFWSCAYAPFATGTDFAGFKLSAGGRRPRLRSWRHAAGGERSLFPKWRMTGMRSWS